jgi:hypothetical protein
MAENSEFFYIGKSITTICRSQWPRCLRHELSSPARTLGSWFESHSSYWYLCVFILRFCCPVCTQRASDGLIPCLRSLTDYIKIKNWKSCQSLTKGLLSHNNDNREFILTIWIRCTRKNNLWRSNVIWEYIIIIIIIYIYKAGPLGPFWFQD